jgi:hypothetical protein
MGSLEGLFSIPFLLIFSFIGWLLWEGIFWMLSFVHIAVSF